MLERFAINMPSSDNLATLSSHFWSWLDILVLIFNLSFIFNETPLRRH